jgi:DNA-directed RNA polymerase specialized sigma24 family protein
MDIKIMAVTLLSSLSRFERMLETSRKIIDCKMLMTFNQPDSFNTSSEAIAQEIYKCSKLGDLQKVIETMLQRTPEKMRKYLLLCYVHKMSLNEVAKLMKVTQRTAQRQKTLSLDNFAERMKYYGIDKKTFMTLINEQPWLRYRDLIKTEEIACN